jgi:hypothetical protein
VLKEEGYDELPESMQQRGKVKNMSNERQDEITNDSEDEVEQEEEVEIGDVDEDTSEPEVTSNNVELAREEVDPFQFSRRKGKGKKKTSDTSIPKPPRIPREKKDPPSKHQASSTPQSRDSIHPSRQSIIDKADRRDRKKKSQARLPPLKARNHTDSSPKLALEEKEKRREEANKRREEERKMWNARNNKGQPRLGNRVEVLLRKLQRG